MQIATNSTSYTVGHFLPVRNSLPHTLTSFQSKNLPFSIENSSFSTE